jgi:hypothetical protein
MRDRVSLCHPRKRKKSFDTPYTRDEQILHGYEEEGERQRRIQKDKGVLIVSLLYFDVTMIRVSTCAVDARLS